MNKKITYIILLFLFGLNIKAQDIHFSQFFNNPLLINPANTAFSENKYRLYMNHRNQWSAITTPYVTHSAAADIQLIKRKYQNDIFGFGLVFNSDKAGDAEFGTNTAASSISYIKSLGNQGQNIIAFGASFAYSQRSLDFSKLNFDSQYNGDFYNPNLFSGEVLGFESFSYYDISFGAKWHHAFSKDAFFNIAYSIWHINNPNLSFMNDESAKLKSKHIISSEMGFLVGSGQSISPHIFYARQASWQELIIGAVYKKTLNFSPIDYKAVNYGLFYRYQDALFAYFALDYKFMTFAVSYDFNVSTLKAASSYRGGMEISFFINYTKKKVKKIQEIKCPVF